MMINNESFYDILEADRHSSREELKQCYQRLVRKHHPDKNNDIVDAERFHLLDLAWKTLSDEAGRKEYDARLTSDEMDDGANVTDTVPLGEMIKLEDKGVYIHHCRCGGRYELPSEMVSGIDDDSPLLVECNTCSLYIGVVDFCTQLQPAEQQIPGDSSNKT